MSGEIKVVSQKDTKEVTIKGAQPVEKTERKPVEIVGGSRAGTTGEVKTYDQHSPVEPQDVQVVTHPDRKSFKEATEKDQ